MSRLSIFWIGLSIIVVQAGCGVDSTRTEELPIDAMDSSALDDGFVDILTVLDSVSVLPPDQMDASVSVDLNGSDVATDDSVVPGDDSESPDDTLLPSDTNDMPCSPADCDDGVQCNGLELCIEDTCVPGEPIECDDSDPCTDDECTETDGCTHTPLPCNDDDDCTVDGCSGETGECTYTAIDCSDGLACNGLELCNAGACVSGVAPTCDDGNQCTLNSCVEPDGCVSVAVDCDDNDQCTTDSCEPSLGCVTEGVDCDDTTACTIDTCDASTGLCIHTPKQCDDGLVCNGVETCFDGACIAGVAPQCDDGESCTNDACVEPSGCISTPKDCNDSLLCTVDSCDASTGECINTAKECSDGSACNGIETCSPMTGDCTAGSPVVCTDGNACNGAEYCIEPSGGCVTPALGTCPDAPAQCGGDGGDSPQQGKISTASGGVFRLVRQGIESQMHNIIDSIANHWSVTETSLATVLTDLNRSGSSISNGLDCFHSGYTWNTGDQEVDYWWPQGVTGTSDAYDSGTFNGHKLMLVSWYHKAEEDSSTSQYKGVRVSLVRHTSLSDVKYRHLLLAEPTSAAAGLKPLASNTSSVHAGGIVWYKNRVYVAHTSKGLRVFDMSRILAVQTGNKNAIGLNGSSGYSGYGYAYVVPEVERYNRCDEGCCVRFSYVSLDRSTSPPSLLTGEYVSDSEVGRLMRWPLDPETGYLQETDGAVVASQVLFTGKEKIQGALSVDGTYFLSSSAPKLTWPPALGTFYHGVLGQTLQDHAYPSLPEDLYYRPTTDEIWTCTEKPANFLGNTRYCFSYLKSVVLGGCQ